MTDFDTDIQEEVITELEEIITEPPMYKVLLHNDDYTTMDFVVEVLMKVFHKTFEDATWIMLNIHQQGVGICGIYSYEIAETKVKMVHDMAETREFPLRSSMEQA
ncbi:MAG: ATP-dependent Clp protease adaptor ClpS [Desulfobacterales bacterium]|nr:ATP-dependent Clp protease adaptor ClpS [Desulfobacterales bacterium]